LVEALLGVLQARAGCIDFATRIRRGAGFFWVLDDRVRIDLDIACAADADETQRLRCLATEERAVEGQRRVALYGCEINDALACKGGLAEHAHAGEVGAKGRVERIVGNAFRLDREHGMTAPGEGLGELAHLGSIRDERTRVAHDDQIPLAGFGIRAERAASARGTRRRHCARGTLTCTTGRHLKTRGQFTQTCRRERLRVTHKEHGTTARKRFDYNGKGTIHPSAFSHAELNMPVERRVLLRRARAARL
jgi:hypothetical protein